MNREQLSSLVDLLFEMDTVPKDLMKEINKAIAFFNEEDAKNELKSAINSSIPSSDLYSSWEINNLFPEKDMLRLKGDTSVTLLLSGGEKGEYFQPFNGPVTSGFGWRDSTQHNGIDIDLNKGDKVAAAFDGMVRIAKRGGGFGNVVIIRHYNGLETVYAHLSKLKVKPGQVVVAGQIIGLGGSTGHSTGSHLHFEVRFKGVPFNPKYIISFKDQKLLCDEITIKKTKWGIAAYPTKGKFYTVEKGDTVFEIAKHYATTTASIKEINGLSGRVRLKPGQVICVAQ
jgi:murein DD-endopeptidase MepM/ murein hydrolase activator NlpD